MKAVGIFAIGKVYLPEIGDVMTSLFKRIAICFGAVAGSTGFANVAYAGPDGTFYWQNNATVKVDRTAESFPSGYSKSIPLVINPGTTVSGWADAPNGSTTYSGTTIWRNAAGYGCSFTVVVSYNSGTGRYLHTFNAAKEGGSASPATCSITASRNTTTGNFTAYPVIGGF